MSGSDHRVGLVGFSCWVLPFTAVTCLS